MGTFFRRTIFSSEEIPKCCRRVSGVVGNNTWIREEFEIQYDNFRHRNCKEYCLEGRALLSFQNVGE